MFPCKRDFPFWKISTISLIILIVFMSCAKHWMSLAVHFTTTSFAVRTAASATKSRHNSCVWYSRLSTTAANGMVPKRFALHWPKVVSESAPSIATIMQELDLRSIRLDSKKQFKKHQKYRKQNLLEQQFTAEHPNQTWVSDITYFKLNDYWLYLCIILDLFSRKIIGYRVSRNASTNLVTSTFRIAFRERDTPADLTFHSDRGKQYTSTAFTTLLQKCGVKQSFSATARPHDNAVAEAFFASFKREEAYRREYTSEQSFRKSVEQYVQFYNEVRPHRTLRYKTPQAFEAAYHENL